MTPEKTVKTIVEEHLMMAVESNDQSLKNDLGADSLDILDICMKIEEELGITIRDEEIEEIYTYQDLLTLVESKS
jgi:acyl carrier protein